MTCAWGRLCFIGRLRVCAVRTRTGLFLKLPKIVASLDPYRFGPISTVSVNSIGIEVAPTTAVVVMAQEQQQQRQRKILVVDDEAYVSSVLALKFKNSGNVVVTASDGEEGFLAAQQELPDLIVTDFQMPILSGLEMAQRLKAEATTAHIPLLMLTARGHRLLPSEMGRTNIRAVLDKPFSVREVLARAEEIMGAGGGATEAPAKVAGGAR